MHSESNIKSSQRERSESTPPLLSTQEDLLVSTHQGPLVDQMKSKLRTLSSSSPILRISNSQHIAFAVSAIEIEMNACEEELLSGTFTPIGVTSVMNSSTHNMNRRDQVIGKFLPIFENELNRVSNCLTVSNHSIEACAEGLLLDVEAVLLYCRNSIDQKRHNGVISLFSKNPIDTMEALRSAKAKTYELKNMVLDLHHCTRRNTKQIKSLAAKVEEKLSTSSCRILTDRRVSMEPWAYETGSMNAVTMLNDIYEIIRNCESCITSDVNKNSLDGAWVPPSTFERTTFKYWVDDSNLAELMLELVSVLPLLVYGRTGRIRQKKKQNSSAPFKNRASNSSINHLWNCLATPISSVYYDSRKMSLYKERIKRSEGAKLLRARWYGHQKPQGDDIVFLELKTHHEKWVNVKSVKERIAIREKDMGEIFSTTKNNCNWGNIIQAANPTIGDKALRKGTDLITKISKLVREFDLRPCVRSTYVRAAFQSNKNNELRFTVDRNITLMDERGAPDGMWSTAENANISWESLVKVPYAVFELKLAGNDQQPPFIQKLDNAGTIVSAHKFSKFLTGAAAFNSVATLPWWSDHPSFARLFHNNKIMFKQQSKQSTNINIGNNILQEIVKGEKSKNSDGAVESNAFTKSHPNMLNTRRIANIEDQSDYVQPKEISQKGKVHGYFGNMKNRWKRVSESSLTNPPSNIDKKGRKKGVRIEPKSHFANERTFIQWISASLLLIAISEMLLVMHKENGSDSARHSGIALIVCAVVIAVYGLAIYYRRVFLLNSGSGYGYTDHIGPAFLTSVVIFAIVVLCVFTVQDSMPELKPLYATHWKYPSSTYEMKGSCLNHNLSTLPSLLEFQPSAALVDGNRALLLVPSRNWITSIPSAAVLSNNVTNLQRDGIKIEKVVDLDLDANIEALEYVGDDLFALSEKSEMKSEILLFNWSHDYSDLKYIRKWNLDIDATAEGMAFVPDSSGQGKLYVAYDLGLNEGSGLNGKNLQDRSSIHIYDIPDVNNTEKTLRTVSKLSAKVLNQGLKDSKIADMQYFENVLYILFDNAEVIRAFDLTSGTMLKEWNVPFVPNFEKQWEGMNLERVAHTSSNASSKITEWGHMQHSDKFINKTMLDNSILVLHLALDSPARVYTIGLETTNELDSSVAWALPFCASPLSS